MGVRTTKITVSARDLDESSVNYNVHRGWALDLVGPDVRVLLTEPLPANDATHGHGSLLGKVLDAYIDGSSMDQVRAHIVAELNAHAIELAEMGVRIG